MKQIHDPGNHWHKDCMPYEEPRPGVTEPDYDEYVDYIDECIKDKEARNSNDVPF